MKIKSYSFKKPVSGLASLITTLILFTNLSYAQYSSLAYPGSDEKLEYKADNKGNRIPDYSVAGYHGGGIPIPDAGRMIVKIDGEITDSKSWFDKHCTYRRIAYFFIDHLEDKEHTVIFEVNAEPFDKQAILSQRNIKIDNPEKYRENNWYVGKILLDGELVK